MRRTFLVTILALMSLALTASVAVIVHEAPKMESVHFQVDMRGCSFEKPDQKRRPNTVHFYMPGC